MACIHVEGFEYAGWTTAMLNQTGIVSGSGFSIQSGNVLEPVSLPGLNGLRYLRGGGSLWWVPTPPTDGGIFTFLARQDSTTSINAGARWTGLRDASGNWIVELRPLSGVNSAGGWKASFRLLVGGVQVETDIPLDLIAWEQYSIVYRVSGSDVVYVALYRGRTLLREWTGSQAVPDTVAAAFGGGGIGWSSGVAYAIDTISVWDDPVGDLADATRMIWCLGRTVETPAAPTQGDWTSYVGATSPSGDISVQIADAQTDRGALTVTPDSELVLGFSALPAGIEDVLCVSVSVRMQGSSTLPDGSLALRSGAATTTPTVESVEAIAVIQQSAALDPDGNVPWTIPAVDALVVVVEATA